MTAFSNTESPEEFKHRLNSLSEKLNRISQNPNASTVVDNKRKQFKEAKRWLSFNFA